MILTNSTEQWSLPHNGGNDKSQSHIFDFVVSFEYVGGREPGGQLIIHAVGYNA